MTKEGPFFTERLVLRAVEVSDFESVLKWENDESNWIQSGLTEPYKEEEIAQYVLKSENIFKDGQTRFIIELKEGPIIGCIDLFDYDNDLSKSSIGVLIDIEYRRKGYGVEALNCLVDIAMLKFNIKSLTALILSTNLESIQLFKKSGFQKKETNAIVYKYKGQDYLQLEYYKTL